MKQFNVVIHPNCWIFSEELVFEIRCIEFIYFFINPVGAAKIN